jgi:uncharacterized protein involved in exopolysaccharide biosynthesis
MTVPQDTPVQRSAPEVARANAATGGSIWRYATVLLRGNRTLLLLPIVLSLAVGALSLAGRRQYVAVASFQPENSSSPQLAGFGQLATQIGLTTAGGITGSPEFYVYLLNSNELLRDVLLTQYRVGEGAGFSGDLLQYYGIRRPTREQAVLQGITQLKTAIVISPERLSNVVSVRVFTENPGLSVAIADRLLDLLNQFNLRRRQSHARAEREFLEGRLVQAGAELRAAEDALSTFYVRNRSFRESPKLIVEEARLQRQVAMRQQIFASLAQNLENAKLEEVRNTPVITVTEHPAGFVAPWARRTVLKAAVSFVLGVFLLIGFAVVREYVRAQREHNPEFTQFIGEAAALRDRLPFRSVVGGSASVSRRAGRR